MNRNHDEQTMQARSTSILKWNPVRLNQIIPVAVVFICLETILLIATNWSRTTIWDGVLLAMIVLGAYALYSLIMLVLLNAIVSLVGLAASIPHHRGIRLLLTRFRFLVILIVAAVFLIGSMALRGYFYSNFADPDMIAWSLFIVIGSGGWLAVSLIVFLIRLTRKTRPTRRITTDHPGKAQLRTLLQVFFGWSIHPMVLPGYVIGAAILLNMGWMRQIIDFPAMVIVLFWMAGVLFLRGTGRFNRACSPRRTAMLIAPVVLLPFLIRFAPQTMTVIAQHGILARRLPAINRLFPQAGLEKTSPSTRPGPPNSLPDRLTPEPMESENLPSESAPVPVRPEDFDARAWAMANRQDYPWMAEPLKEFLAPYRSWNVILITVDSLRADHMSCYGYRFPTTPHIDRLAADGVIFERNYTQGGDSIFSLNSLMSGMMPWNYRNDVDPMLPSILGNNGLATAYVGYDYVLKGGAFRSGFAITELLPGDRREVWGESTSRQLVDEIIRTVDSLGDRQFFIYSHLLDPHADYVPNSLFGEFVDSAHPGYDGEIAFTDLHLGRLFIYLRQAGLLERTLIIISADHGEAFGEHGHEYHGRFLYDESIRTPLIMSLPKVPGCRVRIPVGPVHIAPTILEFLGIQQPQAMDGISLLPLVYKGDVTGIEPVEVYIPNENYKKRGIIYGPWKLIDNTLDGTAELYYLPDDPGEMENLWGKLKNSQ